LERRERVALTYGLSKNGRRGLLARRVVEPGHLEIERLSRIVLNRSRIADSDLEWLRDDAHFIDLVERDRHCSGATNHGCASEGLNSS